MIFITKLKLKIFHVSSMWCETIEMPSEEKCSNNHNIHARLRWH